MSFAQEKLYQTQQRGFELVNRKLSLIYRKILTKNRIERYLTIFNAISKDTLSPELVTYPKGSKILILSPHPDDDVFGCGGTVLKYPKNSVAITTVYITDGRKGSSGSRNEEETVRIRKQEAISACKILGISQIKFLENRDSELKLSAKTLNQMIDVIKNARPELVYLPFLTDNHADHFETNRILVKTLEKLKFKCNISAYEAQSPLFPNIIVNVTNQYEKKIKALGCHESQIAKLNYIEAAIGLNKYRAEMNMINGYAEAFLLVSSNFYIELFKKMDL